MAKKIAPEWHRHSDLRDSGTRCWSLPGAGDIQVFEPSREVLRQGRLVRLQPRPFDMLMLMLRRPLTLVSRQTLRETLWGGRSHVSDEVITKCAAKVRAALGGGDTGLLANVYGTGYQLTAVPRPYTPGQPPRAERAPRPAPRPTPSPAPAPAPHPAAESADAAAAIPPVVGFGRRAGDRLLAIDVLSRLPGAPPPGADLAEWLNRQGGLDRLPAFVRAALESHAADWRGTPAPTSVPEPAATTRPSTPGAARAPTPAEALERLPRRRPASALRATPPKPVRRG